MTEPGFFDTLESQLGAGFDRTVERRRARRRRVERVGGIALVVVVVAVVAGIVLRDEPAAAGVLVEQRDGLVYVRLVDVEYRADVIEDAARAGGISVSVDAVPTGPSLVGRFVSYEQDGEDTGEFQKLDADGPAFAGFAIPAGFDGTLVVQVGRPARSDEPYAVFPNALAEGEPLACSGISGVDVGRARAISQTRGVQVQWIVSPGRGIDTVETDGLRDLELDGLRVIRTESVKPGGVTISLAGPDAPTPAVEQTADATC